MLHLSAARNEPQRAHRRLYIGAALCSDEEARAVCGVRAGRECRQQVVDEDGVVHDDSFRVEPRGGLIELQLGSEKLERVGRPIDRRRSGEREDPRASDCASLALDNDDEVSTEDRRVRRVVDDGHLVGRGPNGVCDAVRDIQGTLNRSQDRRSVENGNRGRNGRSAGIVCGVHGHVEVGHPGFTRRQRAEVDQAILVVREGDVAPIAEARKGHPRVSERRRVIVGDLIADVETTEFGRRCLEIDRR